MRHVFRATKMGWGKEKEGIYFDAKYYTKEEAMAEFKPFQGTTQKGYPYTGYEYDGQKYHLDLLRRKKLLDRVRDIQCILTCTHAERVLYGAECNKIRIREGKII